MTPNLSLPLIAASQAQKHITANEATLGLDALAQLAVIGIANTPATASDGDCYIVGGAPAGSFASAAPDDLATYYNGEWTFYTPRQGWIAYVQDESKFRAYDGTWVLLSTLL
ncbi:DUF2793 domain-containing protein [Thalassovita taeanensis]|uniref:DUF2793 domain-containing protein n=1 Tax=Thalassovita taeanensis TaxID=657014 RepID=A0A1H9EXW8_9RHOB|nr:DUF2793 domain-containing protein [Thalassovita taeanensis]SEQ30043.1 Protein of unknown function [Thalassovita taeanensis]